MSDQPRPQFIPPGEQVLLDIRPSVLSILLRPFVTVVVLIALGIAGAWILDLMAKGVGRGDAALHDRLNRLSAWAGMVGVAAAALRVLWETLVWGSCRFVLTTERALGTSGVFSKGAADLPLRNIQHLTVSRTLGERLLGMGTVGLRTAGGAFPEVYWWMIARPDEVLATIRSAVDARANTSSQAPASSPRPLIVGLVGGIGSGKSAVAAEFARLGALVIDSDKESRAALELPRVREELVKWWGPEVLGPDGTINRTAVAGIVFAEPGERKRLEALIHPMVKSTRAELVARAAAEGKSTVVIDAPLLFEAGVDRECDAVVYVDSPREQRLARVKASRGWEEAELTRRENAQLPLEQKRQRADDVVVNDAGLEVLADRVRDLLERIQRRGPRRASGGTQGSQSDTQPNAR